jgi:low affinity Fe/Cu permease
MLAARRNSPFTRFASGAARFSSSPYAFLVAALIVGTWLASGPAFGFSDTWQLVINTGTTIVTFLMVFLIQNAQYRDSEAIHVKLDELIRAMEGAHNALLDLEELDESELARIRRDYQDLARRAREAMEQGGADTGVEELGRHDKPSR